VKFPDGSRHSSAALGISVTHITPALVLNTCMDANVQLTINSFSQLFPDISLTAVNFPDSSRFSRQVVTLIYVQIKNELSLKINCKNSQSLPALLRCYDTDLHLSSNQRCLIEDRRLPSRPILMMLLHVFQQRTNWSVTQGLDLFTCIMSTNCRLNDRMLLHRHQSYMHITTLNCSLYFSMMTRDF